MTYIYHGAPDPMIGAKLVPLNDMTEELEEIKKLHLSKYEGREVILGKKVPLLDCIWNDVVHFLPLHPRTVFELQVNMGIIPEVPKYKFFEIDVTQLDASKIVVYFKSKPGEENAEVKWIKDVDMSTIQTIPEATIAYYKTLIGTGELPFNYQFIPHVLYKGSVDVSSAKIISL